MKLEIENYLNTNIYLIVINKYQKDTKMLQAKKIKSPERQIHWPTLNTVIMVEDALKKSNESIISVAELKRKLPRQVNHITLIIILEYLERSNKIAVTLKGITWIENNNPNLKRAIIQGMEL